MTTQMAIDKSECDLYARINRRVPHKKDLGSNTNTKIKELIHAGGVLCPQKRGRSKEVLAHVFLRCHKTGNNAGFHVCVCSPQLALRKWRNKNSSAGINNNRDLHGTGHMSFKTNEAVWKQN